MPATTLPTARVRMGQDMGIMQLVTNTQLGATPFAAGTITNAFYFANPNWDSNYWFNKIAHRPGAATIADAVRYLGTNVNTTGVVTISPVYTDVTVGTETLEIWDNVGLRPDFDIFNALNQALEFIYFQAWEPLSLAADAAMREVSPTASWGTAVNATPTKIQTAARVYPGFIRTMTVTNSSANGYQPTTNIAVTPAEPVIVAALSRRHSGTSAQMTFWDVTNAAVFGTAVTHSNKNYQLMMEVINPPAGCFEINVRLGGTGASDVVDYQALWVLRPNASTPIILPASYMQEGFQVEGLAYSRFPMGTSSARVTEGLSMEMTEIPKEDYSTNFMAPAANPMFVQFHNMRWFRHGFRQQEWLGGGFLPWVELRLPFSEQGIFSTEASSTLAPLHLLIPAAIVQALEPAGVRSKVPRGDEIYAKAMKDFKAASQLRAHTGPARRTPHWRMVVARN